MAFKVPNQYRIRTGPMGSNDSIGLCGAFEVPIKRTKPTQKKKVLVCIADDGRMTNWEHVSCYKHDGFARYIPSWSDMCKIVRLFWEEEDCVVEYHPPKSESINISPFVLHLWRPIGIEIPKPPVELV